MSDFVVMRKGAIMAIASPNVTSIAINKPIDPEDLGGWKLLTGVSGLADHGGGHATSRRSMRSRRFCRTCRATAWSRRPCSRCRRARTRRAGSMLDILPESRNKVYDVRKIIAAIADTGSSFELKERFGRSVATVLARLDGQQRRLHREQSAVQGRRARRRRVPEGDELHGAVRLVQHPDRVPRRRARAS